MSTKTKNLIFGVSLVLFSSSLAPISVNAAMVIGNAGVHAGNITNGLVGWWTFDGGDMTSTVAFDKSGNSNHGSVVGATKSVGKVGQGLLFDGVNDRVTVSDTPFDFGSGNFTVAAWVYPTTGVEGAVIAKDGISVVSAYYKLVSFSGQYQFLIYKNTGCSDAVVATSPLAYPLKQWQHAVGVRDGSGSIKLYVNGQLVAQTSGSACGSLDSTYPLEIGVIRNSTNSWFPGKIDDARVYSRALSANEVYSLYQYGNAKINVSSQAVANQGTTNGLVGHWTFNGADRTATTVFDKSGNNKNGIVTGSSIIPGKIGQGIYFPKNGSANNTVNLGNYFAPLPAGDQTYSAWFKNDPTNIATKYFLGKYNAGNAILIGDRLTASPSSGIACSVRVNSVLATPIDGDNHYDDGKWHHLVCTKTMIADANDEVKLYIDGQYRKSVTANLGGAFSGSANFYIGDYGTPSEPWKGGVDDVRIYSRELSANEVYSLYQYGNAKINVASQAVANQGTKSGLVGHWTFNGGDTVKGATSWFRDLSGNSNDATTTNATVSSGKIGQAAYFNGVSSVIRANPSNSINNLTKFTISMWVKTPTPSATQILLRKIDLAGNELYQLSLGSSKLKVNTTVAAFTGNTTILANKWYHFVGVYDGANVVGYINGVADGTPQAQTGTITTNAERSLVIGATNTPNTFFSGSIDDVRIYNTALSANEIYSLYMYGK